MRIWKDCVLKSNSTIREVIQNLNETSGRIVLIVGDESKFLGVVVDGDIRRGILNGAGIDDPVTRIINQNPKVISPSKSRAAALELMETLNIAQLPIVDETGKLIGMHTLEKAQSDLKRRNHFVVMAGGFGKRMGSYTANTPKPMLEVAGKPILEHLILRAKNSGFVNFVVAVHYLGELIEQYFNDGSRLEVNIEYIRENHPMGTVGALSLMNPIPDVPFVVSNADLVSSVDFGSLLDFHTSNTSDATIAVRTHEWQNPFGVVELNEEKIVAIREKPIVTSNISAGIYVFNPNVMNYLIKDEYCDMPNLIDRLLKENKSVSGFPVFEPWKDIGRKSDLDSAVIND